MEKTKQKRIIIFISLLIIVAILSLSFVKIVSADSIDDFDGFTNSPVQSYTPENKNLCGWQDFAHNPINCTLLPILGFMGVLLSAAASLFAWIIDPENLKLVINENVAIYKMWSLIRDMLNIAFILVLLFSAFATIFQVTNYNYKKILLNLVIMALLVNFSFPIARFLVDVGNVVMYSTINNLGIMDGGDPLSTIAAGSALDKILHPGAKAAVNADSTYLIACIIFTFMLAVTFLIIAFLFVIRTVALAILIIFSPIAFTGAIISLLEPFSKKWWTSIWNYSIFGATMTFMIYVAMEMIRFINEKGMGRMENIVVQKSVMDPSFLAAISFYAIPLVILWMGIATAKEAGVVGANLAVGTGAKFMSWAGRTLTGYRAIKWSAKEGITAGAQKFERDVLGHRGLSPRAFLEAWKENWKKSEEEKLRPAVGAWKDRLNKSIFFGKKKTNNEQLELDRMKSKEQKEFEEVSQDDKFVNSTMASLIGKKSNLDRAKLKGLFTILFNNNDQDELMDFVSDNLDKKNLIPGGKTFREVLGIGKDVYKSKQDEEGNYLDEMGNIVTDEKQAAKILDRKAMKLSVSAENVVNTVDKIMETSGTSEKERNKLLLDLSGIAAAKGGIGFGSIRYDTEKKEFVRNNINEGQMAQAYALKVLTTGEAQNIPKTMHRNHFTDQDGNLNESGKELLFRYASPTAIKHIERHKPDFYKRVGADDAVARQMYEFARDLNKEEAMLYDAKANKRVKIKGQQDQAKKAVAWIAALQFKSGVSAEKIKKSVSETGGFKWDEIQKIASEGGVKIEAGKPGAESGIKVEGGSYSSRGKTTFDEKGQPK